MGVLSLRFLGGVEILGGNQRPLDLRSRKATALLAFLALQQRQTHGRDKLASLLWAGRDDKAARGNLRQALFSLRRALPPDIASTLETEGEAVSLDAPAWDVDVASFRSLAEADDLESLDQAAALYRGDFLDGLQVGEPIFDDWVASERSQLRELAQKSLTRLFEARRDVNDIHGAIATGLRLLALDQLQEPVHRALMRLYAQQGRRDAALRQYETCRRILEQELDVKPETATTALYEQIRRQRVGQKENGARNLERADQPDDSEAVSEHAGSSGPTPTEIPARAGRHRRAAAVVGIAALVAIAAGIFWQGNAPPMAPAGDITAERSHIARQKGPAIAVMPFINMDGDPAQDYFADGMTEQLIAELARFQDLFVIARNSVFQYKGRSVDVRAVAGELGVRYVIEGSVRRDGEAVRVTAQLIDATTGGHLWSESYNGKLDVDSIFGIQDAVAEQVVGALATNIGVVSRTERWRARESKTDNLDAYYCVLKAHDFVVNYTNENHVLARDCLVEAVKLDPDYVEAWAWLAWVYIYGYADDLDEAGNYQRLGQEAARRAVLLDPANQTARYAMALSHFFRQNVVAFREESEVAISLNPSNAFVAGDLAVILSFTGDWDRGHRLLQDAMARNPIFPNYWWYAIAKRHLARQEFDEAITAIEKVAQPDFWIFQLASAYIYAHAGRIGDAERAIKALLELSPDMTVQKGADLYVRYNFEPSFVALVIDGLRSAGLREGDDDA